MGKQSKEARKQYYDKNKDTILEKQRNYYYKNKEKFKKRQAKYYQKFREDRLKKSKEYNSRPETKLKKQQYYKENRAHSKIVHKIWEDKNIHRRWAYGVLDKHKIHNFNINISINMLTKLAIGTKRCPYCRVRLKYRNKVHGGRRDSASLDRIHNGKSIDKDNIQILCMRCNATKHDRTHEEFVKYCNMICEKYLNREILYSKEDDCVT